MRASPSVAALVRAGALALAVGIAANAPGERTHVLVEFPKEPVPIARWMKANGWERQRGNPRRFTVGDEKLGLVSEHDSVAIGTEEGFPIDARATPLLRFRVRIRETPKGTDLSRKSGDDAAFRLYVAFDRDKPWFGPSQTIAYTWSEDLEVGEVVQSAYFDNLRYLSVGKGRTEGEDWISIERNLEDDYRTVFPKEEGEVPRLMGILLKCDSNNTGTSARSEVGRIVLAGVEEDGDDSD